MDVAKALRQRRIELGLTQRDVGLMLRVAPTAINDHEAGRKSPILWTLVRWADALGMQVQVVAKPVGRQLRPCGTVAAAKRHRDRGEPRCDSCTAAIRKHDRERKAAKRAAIPYTATEMEGVA